MSKTLHISKVLEYVVSYPIYNDDSNTESSRNKPEKKIP